MLFWLTDITTTTTLTTTTTTPDPGPALVEHLDTAPTHPSLIKKENDETTTEAPSSSPAAAVGGRDGEYAAEFMDDVKARLTNRVQLTTDGLKAYLEAVENTFGSEIDYAQLVKMYGSTPGSAKGRYSPAECNGIKKTPRTGNPDTKHISTSHVERNNLTMRMCMRRFTRLTNGFSKKLENYIHMLSLYFVHYNFCLIQKSLKVTPAMEASLSDTLHDMEWIVGLIDTNKSVPNKRGPYRKKISN